MKRGKVESILLIAVLALSMQVEKMCIRDRGERVPRKRPQRIGPSNCLAKTQVYANPQGEVYGLTPARCLKVKGRCQETKHRT